jgi:uncharacterized protein (TIGR03437 family)
MRHAAFLLTCFAAFSPIEAATLSVNPTDVEVNIPRGSSVPVEVTVTLSGAARVGVSLSVSTGSGGPWLSVDRTSLTVGASPATFNFTVNSAILTPGTYQGTVSLTCVSGATCPAATVNITTIVPGPPGGGGGGGAGLTISVSPSTLQIWAATDKKSVTFPQLRATGTGSANLAVSPFTTDGGAWLSATLSSPTITAGGNSVFVTVNADPTQVKGIPPPPPISNGTTTYSVYTGQLTITATPGNIVVIGVTLNVFVGIDVTFSPAQLQFSVLSGQQPLAQRVTAISAGAPVQDFTSIVSSKPWVRVNPAAAGVFVNVDPTGLDPNLYDATITLQSPGIAGTIYVTAAVTGPALISPDQTSLSFPLSAGGAASQKTVNIVATANPAFFTPSVTAGANWLQVQSNSTATPAVLTVTANPGSLAPGSYPGNIRITPASGAAPSDIAVTMTLTATTSLTTSPAGVSLSLFTGGTCSSQQVAVSSASPSSGVSWSASGTVASGPNWITVTPASGSTPGSLVVSCNGSGLGPGAYTGSVKIAAASASTTLGVTLTVGSGLSMVSAASGDPRLSSGMIASVYGSGLSSNTTSATTSLGTTLNGVSVTVRDSGGASRACPLIFVSPGQINLVIPDATAPGSATLIVNGPSGVVASTAIQIAAIAPGIFTMDSQPSGPAAVLAFFYDANGKLLSQPEAFHCTGTGACNTVPLDVNGGPTLIISLYGTGFRSGTNFTARIGATSITDVKVAATTFAGEDQMNIVIPKSLAGAGEVALVITANGIASNGPHINLR